MPGPSALRLLWGPLVAVAAFLATGATALVTFAMGLVVTEDFLTYVGRPVAAALTGVAAALAAVWAANLFAPDRSRTRLDRVLLWSEAAALAGLVLFHVLDVLASWTQSAGTNAARLAPLVALVAGAAAFSSLRSRRPKGPLRRDAWISLGLALLIPVGLYATVGLACLLERCGA